jgi:uncharacterized membrane protein (UPF0127 family)
VTRHEVVRGHGYLPRVRHGRFVDELGDPWTFLVPETFRERARGLSGMESLDAYQGMLLEHCRSVHTFGMRFPIDVVFLGRLFQVVDVCRLPPRRLALPRIRARHVLECAAGSGVEVGQRFRPRSEPDP